MGGITNPSITSARFGVSGLKPVRPRYWPVYNYGQEDGLGQVWGMILYHRFLIHLRASVFAEE